VLEVDTAMRQVLMTSATESAVGAQAKAAGMMTMRAAALAKARRGETTFEEVIRVTHSDHTGGEKCQSCHRGVEAGMVACPWCGVADHAVGRLDEDEAAALAGLLGRMLADDPLAEPVDVTPAG
jgi:hypothetical protein